MSRAPVALFAIAMTLSTSGCAAVFRSSHTSVSVRSEPSGAEVWVGGTKRAMTPCELSIASDYETTIKLQKPGYRSVTYVLERSVGLQWVALDLLVPPAVLIGGGLAIYESVKRTGPADDNDDYGLIPLAGLMAVPPVVLLNLLVDALTGEWKTLGPTALEATLQPDSAAAAARP